MPVPVVTFMPSMTFRPALRMPSPCPIRCSRFSISPLPVLAISPITPMRRSPSTRETLPALNSSNEHQIFTQISCPEGVYLRIWDRRRCLAGYHRSRAPPGTAVRWPLVDTCGRSRCRRVTTGGDSVVTDPDDALRRDLGWTGSEGSEFEPDTGPTHRPQQAPAEAAPRTSFREPAPQQPPQQVPPHHAKQPAHPLHDGRLGPSAPTRPEPRWEQQPGWPVRQHRPQPTPPGPQPPHAFAPPPGPPWPAEGGFAPD